MFKVPRTRESFWLDKIGATRVRDEHAVGSLKLMGWRVMVVWECAVKGTLRLEPEQLLSLLQEFVLGASRHGEIRGGDPRILRR